MVGKDRITLSNVIKYSTLNSEHNQENLHDQQLCTSGNLNQIRPGALVFNPMALSTKMSQLVRSI